MIARPATRRLAIEALDREVRRAELIRLPDLSGCVQPVEAQERAAKARQLKRYILSLGK